MTKINVHPLRVWRASQGLTQLELARLIGHASQSIVRGIETYALDPRATEIVQLLKLSNHELTFWDFVKGGKK